MGLRKPPNIVLNDDEIQLLMEDIRAIGAKEANVSIKHNDFIRSVLHGYN